MDSGLPRIPADDWEWVEEWIEIWARSEHESTLGEGYPDHSPVIGGAGYGGYREKIAEDWREEQEHRAVGIIDMMMGHDSHVLAPSEKCAVLHMKRCAVFRLERAEVETLYQSARRKIGERLRAADFG